MNETPYQNREIREMVDDIKERLKRIEFQTTSTNGKLRKVIVGLLAVGFFALGLGLKEITPLLAFLLAL